MTAAMQPPNGPAPSRARPVEEIRIGAVRAAIWRNDTEAGVRHNVTFERIYRDGDQWRSTSSFGRDDLLVLAKVADQAHTWIHGQGREAGSSQADTAPTTLTAGTAAAEPAPTRARRSPDTPLSKGRLPSGVSGA